MPSLQHQETVDTFKLRSAQGYYELGMMEDCTLALAELPAEERLMPEGLELSILVCLDRADFSEALDLCEKAITLYPNAPFGYVNQAFACHEMGSTGEALRILEAAHLVVTTEPVAVYNRGCYLACLDRHTEAIFWINKAIRLDPQLRNHAATDPDVKPIFHRLEPAE